MGGQVSNVFRYTTYLGVSIHDKLTFINNIFKDVIICLLHSKFAHNEGLFSLLYFSQRRVSKNFVPVVFYYLSGFGIMLSHSHNREDFFLKYYAQIFYDLHENQVNLLDSTKNISNSKDHVLHYGLEANFTCVIRQFQIKQYCWHLQFLNHV